MEKEKRFGYGRPHSFPADCWKCKRTGVCSAEIIQNGSVEKIIQKYLSKEIDLECLSSNSPDCNLTANAAASKIVDALISTDVSTLVEYLRGVPDREAVTTDNIPQYGDLSIAMYLIPVLLSRIGPIGYVELGKRLFFKEGKRDDAYRKYAENHCKLAASLDLATITKTGNAEAVVSSSVMGELFTHLPQDTKDALLPRLCLRIPIVQSSLLSENWHDAARDSLSILSASTRERRARDVFEIIEFALDE